MARLAFIGFVILASAVPSPQASARTAAPNIVIDDKGVVREYYGVPRDLTLKQLSKLPFKYKLGEQIPGEGSGYSTATITAREGVKIEAWFSNYDGSLWRFKTSTPNARGLHGVGVGSTLAELQKAFPSRRPHWGTTTHDEYSATFGTGTCLTYHFSPYDLPKEAWSNDPKRYELPPSIKVTMIAIEPINPFAGC